MATELKAFSGSQFIGKPVLADSEFIPHLDNINSWAKSNRLKIFVTSSARSFGVPVVGSIVPPARRSNHLVGHALDMNIQVGSSSTLLNSVDLRSFGTLPASVKKFIDAIRRDPDLRWGGDFSPADPVHIDDELNGRDPSAWNAKFSIIQAELTGLTQPGVSAVGGVRLLLLTRPLMKGADVKALQGKLINLGYNVGASGADGLFGADTEEAVAKFQEDQAINPIDGIVGDKTRQALGL